MNFAKILFKKLAIVNMFRASKEKRFKDPKGNVLGMSEQRRNRENMEMTDQNQT